MNKEKIFDLPSCWYQIMPDKFAYVGSGVTKRNNWSLEPTEYLNHGGTLQGIAEKVENGYFEWISKQSSNWGLYLTSIHENASSYHKYWPDDHRLIDKDLGGKEGLCKLVASLENVGGRLMVDLVFNHSGIAHYFFLDIMMYGAKSQYYSHYRKLPDLNKNKLCIPILDQTRPFTDQYRIVSNYTLIINDRFYFPHIGECIEIKQDRIEGAHFQFVSTKQKPNYGAWWGMPELPELNTFNKDVKEYLFDSVNLYLDLGIRHFRLDVPDALPNAEEFWREFRQYIESRTADNTGDSNIYLVGEVWDWKTYSKWLKSSKGNSSIFDAVMNYPFRRSVINFLGSENVDDEYGKETGIGSWNATQTRGYLDDVWGKMGFETRIKQLNLLGSHDVSRLGTLIANLQDRKTALTLLYSYPGIPSLYYGDELGIKGRGEAGARKTMIWLGKDAIKSEDKGLIDFLGFLLNLRKSREEWTNGRFEWVGNHDQILAFERIWKKLSSVIIAAPTCIDDSILLKWIQELIIPEKYWVLGLSENIDVTDLTEEMVRKIRTETGAIIGTSISLI